MLQLTDQQHVQLQSQAHNLAVGDIVQLDNVTLPGGTGYSNSDFEDKNFQVITVPTQAHLQLHNLVMHLAQYQLVDR